jgi:hypothetical protein
MSATSKHTGASVAKMAIAVIGAGFFFVASLVVTYYARRSQASGLPFRSGNGRDLSYADGYKVASILLILSLVYGWRAWSLTHRKAE